MSKRRSSTTKQRSEDTCPRLFVDRALGRYKLIDAVKGKFPDIIPHDDIFHQRVRDPEYLYCCGRLCWIVITSDKDLINLAPHRAAIELGKTIVFCFTGKNRSSEGRANALTIAQPAMFRYFRRYTVKRREPFIGVISLGGDIRPIATRPNSNRKLKPEDVESYERAKQFESKTKEQAFVIPDWLRRSGDGPTQDTATTEGREAEED